MKYLLVPFAALLLISCNEKKSTVFVETINWEKRSIALNPADTFETGKTYLSVYPQIYSRNEDRTEDLTATVSLRNVSTKDSVYLLKAGYFHTSGKPVRTYFEKPIYLAPLETVEIILADNDNAGGSGANFIFDWKIKPHTPEPLFECVMLSTSGGQGISFTTKGVRTN